MKLSVKNLSARMYIELEATTKMIYEAKGNESNGVSRQINQTRVSRQINQTRVSRQINQTGVSCQTNKLKVSRLKLARGGFLWYRFECVSTVQLLAASRGYRFGIFEKAG